MKTFEQYKLKDIEKRFYELTHINELVILFNFIEYPSYMFYCYDDDIIFSVGMKKYYFTINKLIISIISTEFNYKPEIMEIIENQIRIIFGDKFHKIFVGKMIFDI
ncbi:hypothetical protein M0Q50_05305 [bacterium]|jgi:hypothetical protein|nr:hypothetical protein [bacterium]